MKRLFYNRRRRRNKSKN